MSERKPWWDDLSTFYGKVRLGIVGLVGPIMAFSLLARDDAVGGLGAMLVTAAVWIEAGASLRGYHTRPTKIASDATLLSGGLLLLWHEVVRWWM